MSGLRKLLNGARYALKEQLKKIDDSFCLMCENAYIHLVSRYLQAASKCLPVLAELSGLEWSWAGTS